LKSMIRKAKIQSLKEQLALCQTLCESLAKEFEAAALTGEQKAVIAHHWEKERKEGHSLQLAIDLLERQEATSSAPRQELATES